MQIIVDSLVTHYELTGKGKLVLLLHGWGDNLQGLHGLQNELSKKYQVLALDLPGFGATGAPKDVWGLDEYAHFVQATLKKLELKQPYALLGHSHGGAVAVRGLGQGILKADMVVLLAPAGIRNKQAGRRILLTVLAKTGNLATLWMPEKHRKRLRASLYQAAGSDLLVVPELEATFKKTVRQDVQADAANIKAPTLMIFGAEDQAVPVADAQTYHQLVKNSELHIIDGAGHFVHLDQPAKVLAYVKGFLK